MDLYQIISYPLFAGGILQVVLGIALLKQTTRNSKAMHAVATLFFSAAGFALCTAISYTLESQGRDFNFFNRASWIGWFMIPACMQFAYYIQDENSRAARIVGYVLYPFWSLVFALTLFTDLVEPGDHSLIPFVGIDGPLEKPGRIIGTIMAIWLLVVLYRSKNRLTGIKKAQMELFFYGTLFFNVGCILIAGILPLFGAVNSAFTTFVSLPWVVITYYAITRHRLFDMRLMLSRMLNIALLSILFYLCLVVLFKFFSPALGESLALLLSISIIGLLFFGTQLSRNVQQWTQRLVLKNRYDYQNVLKESIKAIITILQHDELLDYIIASMKKSLRVEKVCIALQQQDRRLPTGFNADIERESRCPANDAVIAWLRQTGKIVEREELEHTRAGDTSVRVYEYMIKMNAELIIPLSYKGELKGYIVLGQKGDKDPYVQSDFDLLEMLAGQAVVAIENARLFEDARRSRIFFKESEEKFRTLAETAEMAIFIHQGGNFLYANRAAEVIGGYSADEYLAMNLASLVHPDYVELVKTRTRERLDGSSNVPTQYEFKIKRKNGEERWVLMTDGVTEFEGRSAVIGTLIDVTARRQAEEERHRMSLLIENSSDYIAMSDMDGHILFVNQAGRRLVGLDSNADVRKLTADDFYFPEDLPLLRENRRSNDWRGEFRLKHFKTCASIPVEWYVFNVTDEATGRPIARAAVMRDIGDLKRAREERERYYEQLQQALTSLKESEVRFRTLAEATTASIIIHRGGKFLYTNPAVQKNTGYTQNEMAQMEFWEIVHPEFRDLVRERGQALMAGVDLPREAEFKVLTRNGEERWTIVTSGIIQFEGQPAVMATAFDITDRKRSEGEREQLNRQLQRTLQSLKESEAKFRSLAETAPAAIFIHQGGNFLYANAASSSMIGYTREEFLAMDFWGVTHPEDKEMIIRRARARITGDLAPDRYEFRLVTKSGEVRWVDMSVGVINYEGRPAVMGTAFDITARKRSEEELEQLNRLLQQALQSFRESEAKFRTLAETTSAIIFIHRGGKGLYTNAAGVAIAGYTNEEFRAMDFWSIIHPHYQELVKERERARLRGEQLPPEYEFKIITKKGEERWINMTAGVISYEGEPAVIGTLFDITGRKRAEEEKVKLYEQQLAVEKRHLLEKEKILMDLHDGIGGITTNISILSELGQKATDIEKIKKTLFTISRLSREGVSEIRSFMHSLDGRDLNWRTLAAELRSQGINMVEPHNISFTAETNLENIQEQPGSLLWVNLFKIYKEALTNVIKHSKADSVAVALTVAHDELRLTVQDNGTGWSENPGRGRGLSNMEKRAAEVGGKVTFSSGNGIRMRLEIHIPIKYPETAIEPTHELRIAANPKAKVRC